MMRFSYLFRKNILNYLLLPFSWLYQIGFKLIQLLARPSVKLPVPLIVVGNLTVGGNGKTPLVIALAQHFRKLGYRPGILTRGYGGKLTSPTLVMPKHSPQLVGDEALILAINCSCPVILSRRRELGISSLVDLNCNILISDDGLQRKRLPRTVEIVVVDELRGFGNNFCLPAGPLREPLTRLQKVDYLIINTNSYREKKEKEYTMWMEPLYFQNLADPNQRVLASNFFQDKLVAFAGLGNPEKFFATLRILGLNFSAQPLPDHYFLTPEQLPSGVTVLMTEKDAVKLPADANLKQVWFLKVEAKLTNTFWTDIEQKIAEKIILDDLVRG